MLKRHFSSRIFETFLRTRFFTESLLTITSVIPYKYCYLNTFRDLALSKYEFAKSRGLRGSVGAWVKSLRGLRGLRGSKYFLRGS